MITRQYLEARRLLLDQAECDFELMLEKQERSLLEKGLHNVMEHVGIDPSNLSPLVDMMMRVFIEEAGRR